MKKMILFAIASICSLMIYAQQTLPSVDLKTLDGKAINTKEISNDGKPFAICFWATWCKPCLMELSTFAELYEEWQEETGMKIFAVSIDDSRTQAKVQPLVNTSEWEYEILLDVNSEFKRAMGVNNPPHTFVVNGKGEIVWQHVGYAPGDEEGLIEAIRKVIAEEK
ncbi:MAG: TlpA family protein disulfide reductase [Bacteroidales bacterium]|jgi:peroxiredoxin|nr:TlpA family protein disulfide reductase [Bacteroidales bacterium]MBQ2375456.1 TlpA family protein disulfide reductase [Bacteroidales bacterium]MBQ2396980.1 TlpA family protein disulfide reductase [Bacteroidales bacterium]MBQ5873023.1 TlpA family protein disulfide reductase [Bacteroidales bacterium]MBQ5891232.1 TlpA family protein disulfide reductase [Bacteroidales bacterium]